ncbi:hypothetical protein UN63_14575 [Oceanisphaera arctica]|uniref:Lipoprotein n=1 Tax=Oceanisphaera arctica TaxID=641510 RepID=A0A2P5TIZ0_9GAMM|nr:hypothetical protein UN63_14575 [Oceanisphaera arctica]GHA13242.1 lipoprotein [Oceanisphaera arctica]
MLLAVLTGCANHLPAETVNSMDIDRESVRQDYVFQAQGVNQIFIDQPSPSFSVTDHESFRVTTYSVNKTLEVYTPYQPLRELYEFPSGILMTTGGVVFSIVDVVPFFGMLPDVMTKDLLANGVTGINPFMNMESHARSEKKVLGIPEREVIDQKVEKSESPLRQFKLTAALDASIASLETDERGLLSVDLLSLMDGNTAPRMLTLSAANASGEQVNHEFPLTRQLSVRLMQAKNLIDKYQQIDGDKLKLPEAIEDLSTLSRWGFEHNVRSLEQQIREKLDNERRIAFDSQLIQALAG